jgi:hypothetical protein
MIGYANAEYHVVNVVILSVSMLNVIILGVIILSVIILSVIIFNVIMQTGACAIKLLRPLYQILFEKYEKVK